MHLKNVSKQFTIGIVGDGSHSLEKYYDFVIEDTSLNKPRFQIETIQGILYSLKQLLQLEMQQILET